MSPILFALYINGLVEEIKKAGVIGAKIIISREERCGILMFADDIVLIAEDREDLERLMEITVEYSRKWRFTFNYDKCAVVIFDTKSACEIKHGPCKDRCDCGYHWRLGNKLIKQEISYKYLGMELHARLSQKEFKKRICSKAKASLSRVWRMGMRYGSLSVAASLNLYQALVRSVLEYGAEVWTNEEWEEGERVQREMGRRILRCHGKTTNEAVLGELGWWRLQARRDFLKLKYWIKLSLMNDSRLVRQVYLMSRDAYVNMRKKNWCSGIHALAAKYNLRELWRNENLIKQPALLAPQELTTVGLRKYWEGVIWQRIQGVEEQEWKRAMGNLQEET